MSKQLDFIKRYTQIAKEVAAKYGDHYGWYIAQAALESGWGLSEVCVKANNFFGIKGSDPETSFNQGGVLYAKFQTPEECFRYQGWQLSVARYQPCKKYRNDFKKYGDCIQAAGYCAKAQSGQETYGDKIQEIAEQWGLNAEESDLAMAYVTEAKLMRPYGDKNTYWSNQSSRKELAVILYRLVNKLKET